MDPSPRHIVSYFGNRYLDVFEQHLQEIRDHGFTTVVHCVTEADLSWSMDQVGRMFTMTKEAGLECWADPWGVARAFGGEAHSGFLAAGGKACMREEKFHDLLARWTQAVAEAGAEWMFWDEPELKCDCCDGRVPELLDELSTGAAKYGVRSSVCMCCFAHNEPVFGDIAALPHVDDFGCDPYYSMPMGEYDPETYVGKWADLAREAAQAAGISAHIWVQGFGLDEGWEHVPQDAARVAREHGVPNIAFWGFRACEATSGIAPARRELVWQKARDIFAGALTPA